MAVTIDDVRNVFKGTISDDDLTVALETAQLIVTEQLTCGMSTERLDKITIYLAAHFAQVTVDGASGVAGQLRRDKMGDADQSYAVSPLGESFKSSRFGQIAIALDQCNVLNGLGTKLPAQFRVNE